MIRRTTPHRALQQEDLGTMTAVTDAKFQPHLVAVLNCLGKFENVIGSIFCKAGDRPILGKIYKSCIHAFLDRIDRGDST